MRKIIEESRVKKRLYVKQIALAVCFLYKYINRIIIAQTIDKSNQMWYNNFKYILYADGLKRRVKIIMENSKRKGIISILIIAVCLCLCIGATYAYFTDSATSKGNKIQAGKLKVDFELLNKDTLIWNSIKESQDPIFYHEKWEPGYTDVKLLKVDNEETLAIKWEAKFIYEGQLPALANAIEVYVKTSDSEFAYPTSRDDLDSSWEYEGTLTEFAANISTILKGELLEGESDYFGIALYMPTTVEDNTLQGEAIDPFDIQIFATQLAYESDAFDEKYDDITIDSNGGVTPPDTTESTEDTSSSEPKPTEPQPEPTDPDIFTWSENGDGTYTVTGLRDPNSVANIVIPSTYNGGAVTAIGYSAFGWDATIASVTIPDSVTTIGDYAFENCPIMRDVTLGNSIITIGDYAFYGCYELTGELVIPNSVITIGNSAFYDCSGLTGELIIPDSVTTIGDSAFDYCYNLTGELIIPDSVTTIGDYAFHNCYGLTSVVIPNGVTTIGDSAFSSCSSLTSITLPEGVTTIGGDAFICCYDLRIITFDGSVKQWQTIEFGFDWDMSSGEYTIYCTDGTIAKDRTVTYY